MDVMEHSAGFGQADVYKRYLSSVLQATSASGAAVYIEGPGALPGGRLLLRAGRGLEVPEFSNPETAAAAISAIVDQGVCDPESPLSFFPSEAAGSCLLRVAPHAGVGEPASAIAEFERRTDQPCGSGPAPSPCVWIGLYFGDAEGVDALRGVEDADPGAPRNQLAWVAHTLILGASLVWEAFRMERLLRDPTSQLPGRSEFQARLKAAFQLATQTGQSLGLLLINPDEFGAVNERLDRESGDRAVAEVAQLLRSSLRQDEKVFRYGGAVFAVLMPAADTCSVDVVARKIRQSLTGAYLDGAVRLMFSVGAAVYESCAEEDASLDDLGLLRRADHALNLAKRVGGGCSVLWSPEAGEVPDAGVDRLSGIFTANTEKDYRNMLLLWDTIAVLSSSAQKPQIASEFVDRINLSLKPSRVALLERTAAGGFRQVAAAHRSDVSGSAVFEVGGPQLALLEQVYGSLNTGTSEFEGTDPDGAVPAPFVCHAVPIPADGECLACLYIDGPVASLRLDSSDLIFLEALAGQLGLALDRVALAERLQREAEVESRRLREEVQDLRHALHSAKLVFTSRQMHAVLDTLRAVAATDVTILIDGESGTGKEMLARAVHEMSKRRDKPLIIVDCGAIAHNLMEAELFGHVKGAFTGAHGSSQGRIGQAEGGTLFLDEIGEIPLDVQAKLLRFVQEKEINPVGATSSRHVDTRIVAATNRDLGREAAAGRFREDLYYRLKVVTVTAPPLRDRPDDIMPLAKHFLDKFALQYEKQVRRFEPDAELYLQRYQWPGNVRELQNCILRAVVLCSGETISLGSLQAAEERAALPSGPAVERKAAPAVFHDYSERTGDPWLTLQHELAEQVEFALADPAVAAVPLGRWLTEDLVREADRLANGNARRASAQLGIAETTYRRQLEKVRRADSQGLLSRTPNWARTARVISYLVKSIRGKVGGNAVDRAKSLLLAEVGERVSGEDALGAALMGVTVPTYRRWRQVPQVLHAVASN